MIEEFQEDESRAIDQLLNTIHVLTEVKGNDANLIKQIKDLLLKPLSEES